MKKTSSAIGFTSVFNDVLGPVMRGPSSSHTAGSYHIGLVVRQLLGVEPKTVRISFDKDGSYGQTYVQQGVDAAFITGLMGWKQTDSIFTHALESAEKEGVNFEFEVTTIPHADHPNYVMLDVEGGQGQAIRVEGKSVGGGTFRIVKVDDACITLDGKSHATILVVRKELQERAVQLLKSSYPGAGCDVSEAFDGYAAVNISSKQPLNLSALQTDVEVDVVRQAAPVYFIQKNPPPFHSAESMVGFAEDHGYTLGEAVLEYESTVLGLDQQSTVKEMIRRYEVMQRSVTDGLQNDKVNMLLLEPMASSIMEEVEKNRVVIGGIHARASAAAMAAMHTCNSRGVVCAAPTGGAAGTLPGVLTALAGEYDISDERMALLMFAAGGIGLILAIRATFAAEVAGCQVEIGAAGAMASAAVVEFGGGTARQGCDAAAISFQNTMGSVCDLVQGMCELPCHTRNGIAASSAFTNADMILGGYINHINLDETIDAVYSSGLMLPMELRCTARGGLAIAPSAQKLCRGTR